VPRLVLIFRLLGLLSRLSSQFRPLVERHLKVLEYSD
jgi:hypothetical protein